MKATIEISDLILEILIEKVFLGRIEMDCCCGGKIYKNSSREAILEHIEDLLKTT